MADEKDTQKEEQAEESVETKEESAEEKAEEKAEEPKEEPKSEEKEEKGSTEDKADESEEVEVPEEFKDLVDKVEKMSVLELNSLVKVLEKKFGVSAQAVAVSGGAAEAGAAEEKDSFNVELTDIGDSKIGVIKAVKAALGLGLKEAKDLVESAPVVLKEGVKKEDAEEMKKAIEEAGGKVELK